MYNIFSTPRSDTYIETYSCDGCSCPLTEKVNLQWMTCSPCSNDYFSTFDLCMKCFEAADVDQALDISNKKKKTAAAVLGEDVSTTVSGTDEQHLLSRDKASSSTISSSTSPSNWLHEHPASMFVQTCKKNEREGGGGLRSN